MNSRLNKVIKLQFKGITYLLSRVGENQAIYDLWQNSLKIADDWGFYMRFCRELRDSGETLNLAQIYITLKSLCGESNQFFDDWKGSFSFFFTLQILKADQSFDYLLDIRDFRGSLEFSIRRCLKLGETYDKQREFQPFDAEFSRVEINEFISYFYGYMLGYFEAVKITYNEPFFKKVDSNLIIYGYKNDQFFEEDYDAQDAYKEAIAQLSQ